ncbi:MAG: co-chaperone GroES [Candidatus Magasanikbacteria bacterium CG11_big_fil_rev_8_21_14_0_20_39_34]|uniref:Co-chaperonin GroES n=1 Tax=Candidatus Magasanikbacteria bacterium CG11_big_fil_rev_8_21_14_0_20_39_34 TaxID=1974653 RepID=A0A2H0N641_9BACT|nr:MAG: co-chaperone GroES [Candidatus Magasanikbacteria bacterium CG11_big_fil_rev_8_21_14_0_20_39_34]
MNIKPIGNRVLVKLAKEEEITKSGIVLPDTVDKDKKTEGEVVAVGTGKMKDDGTMFPVPVQVGDKVLVKSWGGDEVDADGESYKIFDADDILAILQ